MSSYPLLRGSDDVAIRDVAVLPEGGLVLVETKRRDGLGLVWLGPDHRTTSELAVEGTSAAFGTLEDGAPFLATRRALRRVLSGGKLGALVVLDPPLPDEQRVVAVATVGERGFVIGTKALGPPRLYHYGADGALVADRELRELRSLIGLETGPNGTLLVHGEQLPYDYRRELAGLPKQDGLPGHVFALATPDAPLGEPIAYGQDAIAVDSGGIWAYSRDRYEPSVRLAELDLEDALVQLLVRLSWTGEVIAVYDVSDEEIGRIERGLVAADGRAFLFAAAPNTRTGTDLVEIDVTVLSPRVVPPKNPG